MTGPYPGIEYPVNPMPDLRSIDGLVDPVTGKSPKRRNGITETRMEGSCPDVTIKWRENQPPYVEIRLGDQLMVAGWVHPTVDGVIEPKPYLGDPVVAEPNPFLEAQVRVKSERPRVGGLLTGYRTLSEGNLEYHEQDCSDGG